MDLEHELTLMARIRSCLLGALFFPLIAIGCQNQEEITRYSVPRQPSAGPRRAVEPPASGPRPDAPAGGPERMLAAIVPLGEQVWFFKLVGPEELVSEQTESFRTLIGTITFAGGQGQPQWKLPEGWRQQQASGMRYATIEVPSPKGSLELSVTPLKLAGDLDTYVQANVDRWRQQLGLEPTTSAKPFGPGERSSDLTEVELGDGEKALVVDLTGKSAPSPASGLAGTAPLPPVARTAPGLPTAGAGAGPSGNGPRLTYESPAGWSAGKVDGMRQVAFEIRDGAGTAEVTVIALAAGSGDLLANVNRWREQVRLQPVDRKGLAAQVEDFQVDGAEGQRVELVGPADAQPRDAIIGVICSRGDQLWFFKMKGDAALVARERERFDTFVHSVRFNGLDGADHGP